MKGKAKCKALKEIRRQIAEQNDIPYAVSQCTYQGDCKGTCPKCEAELKYLERELAVRQGLGKVVAVAGISVGVGTSLTACGPIDAVKDALQDTFVTEQTSGALATPEVLEGDVAAPVTEEELGGEAVPQETVSTLDGDIAMPETTTSIEGDIAMPEPDMEGELTLEEEPGTEPTETIDGGYDVDGNDDECDIDEEYPLAGDIAPVE